MCSKYIQTFHHGPSELNLNRIGISKEIGISISIQNKNDFDEIFAPTVNHSDRCPKSVVIIVSVIT